MTTLKLTKQDIVGITEEEVATLASRLEQDEYDSPFEALEDWHLLQSDRLSARRIGTALFSFVGY